MKLNPVYMKGRVIGHLPEKDQGYECPKTGYWSYKAQHRAFCCDRQ